MKFNGVEESSSQGKRLTQTGCSFAYTDAATITMTPDGIDGFASIVTVNQGGKINTVEIRAALTCALTTSGAGGLDTGSEASDKGYYVFLITKPYGKVPKLLCSLSDTSPTMPAGYPFRSDPIWFISNNGDGDIRNFVETNGTCYYITSTVILNTGVAYSDWTLVDASVLVPNNSRAFLHSFARNKNTNDWNSIRVHFNDDDTADSTFRTMMHNNVIRHTNGAPGSQQQWEHGFLDAEEGLYYKWQNNPGSGGSYPAQFHIWCRGWTLS